LKLQGSITHAPNRIRDLSLFSNEADKISASDAETFSKHSDTLFPDGNIIYKIIDRPTVLPSYAKYRPVPP